MKHANRTRRRANARRRQKAAAKQVPLPRQAQLERFVKRIETDAKRWQWRGYYTVTYKDR
jgi:hypothetical protein